MEILLDLRHHCIETALKRRRNAAISRYFKAAENRLDLEAQIDMLGRALQTFDFSALRRRWPVLAGGSDYPVRLVTSGNGKLEIQVAQLRVIPPADL